MNFTFQQRVFILKTYWENRSDMETTQRRLQEVFGAEGVGMPTADEIRSIEATLQRTGTVYFESSSESEGGDNDDNDDEEASSEESSDDGVRVYVDKAALREALREDVEQDR